MVTRLFCRAPTPQIMRVLDRQHYLFLNLLETTHHKSEGFETAQITVED